LETCAPIERVTERVTKYERITERLIDPNCTVNCKYEEPKKEVNITKEIVPPKPKKPTPPPPPPPPPVEKPKPKPAPPPPPPKEKPKPKPAPKPKPPPKEIVKEETKINVIIKTETKPERIKRIRQWTIDFVAKYDGNGCRFNETESFTAITYDVLTGKMTNTQYTAENMKESFKKFVDFVNKTIDTFEANQ